MALSDRVSGLYDQASWSVQLEAGFDRLADAVEVALDTQQVRKIIWDS
jgi:hypothetical protein